MTGESGDSGKSGGSSDSAQQPANAKIVRAASTAHIAAGATVSVRAMVHFSMVHMQSATVFARRCYAIEQAYTVPVSEALSNEHRAYVTGAIFHSIAFLEATINEVFDGAAVGNPAFNPLGATTLRDMATLWKYELASSRSERTLDKYNLALNLADKPALKRIGGAFPPPVGSLNDVEQLIRIRNALMHYKPLWEGGRETEDVKTMRRNLESRFASLRNPLMPTNSHFLYQYLSHACAEWAVETSLRFADGFFARLGAPAPYDHLRAQFGTR